MMVSKRNPGCLQCASARGPKVVLRGLLYDRCLPNLVQFWEVLLKEFVTLLGDFALELGDLLTVATIELVDDIHALGYCPEGDVLADASVLLLSNEARFITGHIMHVSGGAELGYRR